MKKTFSFLIILLAFTGYSQEYGSALGIKTGYPGYLGLNYKKNLDRKTHRFALDNMLGVNFDSDNRYLTGQLLFEMNKKIGFNTGFNLYAGIGPTIQHYINGGYITDDQIVHKGTFVRGDFVLGIEKYNEAGFPINVAFEVGPCYTFVPLPIFSLQFSVALRYGFPETRKKRF